MTNAHQQIKEALEYYKLGRDYPEAAKEALTQLDDCIIIEKSDVPEGFMYKFLIMLETQKRVAVLERGLAKQMEDQS